MILLLTFKTNLNYSLQGIDIFKNPEKTEDFIFCPQKKNDNNNNRCLLAKPEDLGGIVIIFFPPLFNVWCTNNNNKADHSQFGRYGLRMLKFKNFAKNYHLKFDGTIIYIKIANHLW